MKCTKGLELEIMCSNAFYIGTRTEEGWPNCRCSRYYAKKAEAFDALNKGNFVPRVCSENDYCSGGKGCISE